MNAGGIGGLAAALSHAQGGAEQIVSEPGLAVCSGVASTSGGHRVSTVPQTTAWILLTKAGQADEIIAARGDPAMKAQGWWRAGDGSIAVRIKTANGRSMNALESGGAHLAEVQPGKGAKLILKNMTDRRVEVVVDWCGEDIMGQEGFPFQRRGLVLNGGQTFTVSEAADAKGVRRPLAADAVSDLEILIKQNPASASGVVRLSVFSSNDAIRNLPSLNHRLPAGTAQRKAVPRARSFEYR